MVWYGVVMVIRLLMIFPTDICFGFVRLMLKMLKISSSAGHVIEMISRITFLCRLFGIVLLSFIYMVGVHTLIFLLGRVP